MRRPITRYSDQQWKSEKIAYLFVINLTLYCILWFRAWNGYYIWSAINMFLCEIKGCNNDGEGNALVFWMYFVLWSTTKVLLCFSFGILILYQAYSGIRRNNTNSTWFYVWQLLHASLPCYRLNIYLDVNEPSSSVLPHHHREMDRRNRKSHGNRLPKMEICFFLRKTRNDNKIEVTLKEPLKLWINFVQ